MESYMGIGRPPDEIDQGNYGQEITRYNEPLKLENSEKQPMKPNHHLRKPRLTFKCLVIGCYSWLILYKLYIDKLENKLITDDVIKISSTVSVGFLSFMWELSQTYVIAGIGFTNNCSSSHPQPALFVNGQRSTQMPKGYLTLNLWANVLGDFLKLGVGKPHSPCCSLIKGLVDVELDACLCTVVKANILGLVNVEAPIQLGLPIDFCGMNHRDYNCQ
ncbi:Uncharacterized protein TCM_015996 [Theobroma cacao]|uniref:Hydrophobic seed protein domain-containing protein n=1 Tax=Theobroma cacao TaxID=3641 RepID=A0A061G3E5_THECC|nr:Uncharacterized protein TCM_015996 [Theobroma cacao]